jgi:hypothetical protein
MECNKRWEFSPRQPRKKNHVLRFLDQAAKHEFHDAESWNDIKARE